MGLNEGLAKRRSDLQQKIGTLPKNEVRAICLSIFGLHFQPAPPSYCPILMKIRVLIADDHSIFRSALHCLLEMDPAIDVIGEASSGREACRMAIEGHAHVVCMDFRMPDMDGVESTRHMIAAMPHLKIIGLSASFEASTEAEMLAAGASLYVAKANAAEDLLPAIHAMFPVGAPSA